MLLRCRSWLRLRVYSTITEHNSSSARLAEVAPDHHAGLIIARFDDGFWQIVLQKSAAMGLGSALSREP
jgi:hypothetical protein